MQSFYKNKDENVVDETDIFVKAALKIQEIIESHKVVNWKNNPDIHKQIVLEIGDFIYDEVKDKLPAAITFSEVDKLSEEMLSVAKTRD